VLDGGDLARPRRPHPDSVEAQRCGERLLRPRPAREALGGHEPDLPALGRVDRFERRRLEATLAMSALAHDPERWEAVLRRLL
jgi:hypothetical protein